LIESDWGESENKRRAKFYRLTTAGRRRLRDESAYWKRFSEAVGLVLAAAPEDV
jgi:DNA-binding PadR family transcriptional regulator